MGIDFDANGNLFVAQYQYGASIFKVATDGSVSTFISSVPSSRVGGITFAPVPGSSTLTPGDFDRDGVLTQTDLTDLLQAITDENAWKTSHNLSDDQMRAMGDVNGDGSLDNADIQALLNKLIHPSGGPSPVPEPSTIALAAVGLVLVTIARRTPYLRPAYRI
jgi:hypothetical protein